MEFETGSATHTGRVRETNEDSHLVRPGLAVVADGMGGHACGEVASALALGPFSALPTGRHLTSEQVHAAIREAGERLIADIATHPARSGMGTTLAGVALVDEDNPHWLVFNVGDSRVYGLTQGRLSQLTVDHSEIGALLAAGLITPDEVPGHPMRNVVTRALGTDPAPTPDTWILPTTGHDTFMVCSDGLTNELDDPTINEILATAMAPRDAAARLVTAAVEAGGRDNVTVVVLEMSDQGAAPDDASVNTTPRAGIEEAG